MKGTRALNQEKTKTANRRAKELKDYSNFCSF